jgi:hypothetical protein
MELKQQDKQMKIAIALSLLIVSTPTSANAQELHICRPRTNNVIQRVTQKMAFPSYPKCREDGGVKLRYDLKENLNFIRGTAWRDTSGNIYYTIDKHIPRPENSNNRSK